MTEISEAQARVADWVKRIKEANAGKKDADARADQESLERAADLELIYGKFEWVKEMPKPKARRLGRRVNPRSREQFVKWVRQQYEWGSQSYLSNLHDAESFHRTNAVAMKTTEGAIRPLWKLRAEGYGDHLLTVWQRAVKDSGGHPTKTDVSRAVRTFLDEHRPPVKNTASDPRTEAERRAARQAKVIAEFRSILEDGDQLFSKDTLNNMITLYNERDRELNAARA